MKAYFSLLLTSESWAFSSDCASLTKDPLIKVTQTDAQLAISLLSPRESFRQSLHCSYDYASGWNISSTILFINKAAEAIFEQFISGMKVLFCSST